MRNEKLTMRNEKLTLIALTTLFLSNAFADDLSRFLPSASSPSSSIAPASSSFEDMVDRSNKALAKARSTDAGQKSIKDDCLNSNKHFAIENSGTEISGITYTRSGSVILESGEKKLSLDCKKVEASEKGTTWKSVRQKTELSAWDYAIPGKFLVKMNSEPTTLHDDSEFPLRTEVTLTNGSVLPGIISSGAFVKIKDKQDSSGKELILGCSDHGVAIYSKVGSKTSLIYENAEQVRPSIPTPPPVPGKNSDDSASVKACSNSYSIDIAKDEIESLGDSGLGAKSPAFNSPGGTK